MVKINIFGDFTSKNKGSEAIKNRSAIGNSIRKIIKDSDYNIINLENPVAEGDIKPISKNGPCLRCNKDALLYLKEVGFNMVTLANNHFYDYGDEGVSQTINACNENGIDYVGGGNYLHNAKKPKIVTVHDLTIGIINACEHEFSIATEKSGGSNPIDIINIYYQIKELKGKTDKIIIILHCGSEKYPLPSLDIKNQCHYFIDLGADAIICHHTHCYSGYEIYNNSPIFYGLGNFFFDNNSNQLSNWNTGYFVSLNVDKNNIRFDLHPYIQCHQEINVQILEKEDIIKFDKQIKIFNSIISDNEKLVSEYKKWQKKQQRYYISTTFSSCNKIIAGLYRHKLIPAPVLRKSMQILYNMIICESHRKLLIDSIRDYLKNNR